MRFCGYTQKFSLQNLACGEIWGVASFGAAKASNVFSAKIVFFTNSRKFLPRKVSRYMAIYYICVYIYTHICIYTYIPNLCIITMQYYVDYSLLAVPTAPPQSFTVTVLGPRSLRLSWIPPPSDQQNGDILGYTVTIASVETGREEESNTTSTSYSASSLHPYYTYQCKVAAFTSVGLGPGSSVVSRRTRQAGKFLEFYLIKS